MVFKWTFSHSTRRTLVMKFLPTPRCHGLSEIPSAIAERAKLNAFLLECLETVSLDDITFDEPLQEYLSLGLAGTVGSALGERPPSQDDCLQAFLIPNTAGLTAGARAWSKHGHRSGVSDDNGWWGRPRGPVIAINEMALELFQRVMHNCTWRNLHWLPHQILVYEARVPDGYGMRWSQNRSAINCKTLWTFRGYVEPMMENGHDVGWRH